MDMIRMGHQDRGGAGLRIAEEEPDHEGFMLAYFLLLFSYISAVSTFVRLYQLRKMTDDDAEGLYAKMTHF